VVAVEGFAAGVQSNTAWSTHRSVAVAGCTWQRVLQGGWVQLQARMCSRGRAAAAVHGWCVVLRPTTQGRCAGCCSHLAGVKQLLWVSSRTLLVMLQAASCHSGCAATGPSPLGGVQLVGRCVTTGLQRLSVHMSGPVQLWAECNAEPLPQPCAALCELLCCGTGGVCW
jgi:hypothetical protein